MRIGGLASGMDTEQMIKDLMKAERLPVDKMQQDRQIAEWKRDGYREVNTELLNFRSSITNTGIGRNATFFQKDVTSSNSNLVTATALGAAANTVSRVEVERLARPATWQATHEPTYETGTARTLSFKVTDPGKDTARDVSLSIGENDSIQTVIDKINRSSLGVTAMKGEIYNEDTKAYEERIVFTNRETGEGGQLEVLDDETKDFMATLGFTNPDFSMMKNEGQDAIFKVNGFQMKSTSNSATINNINFTFNNVTNGEEVMISARTDTDAIMDEILGFIEKYNELIDLVNGKLQDERHRDFRPLTDEQRRAMSDDEIERWEEKAQSGMLRNDSILSSGLNQLRRDLYTPVSNDSVTALNQLAKLGIVTTNNFRDGGKLVLDPLSTGPEGNRMSGEERLRKAIEEDPEGIYQLFMANGDSYEEKGIIRRVQESINNTISRSITDRAGREGRANHQYTIGREIAQIDNRITNFERRLQQVEDRYRSQFTMMEKAMQQANAQAESLFAQLYGGQ
ncbi:flagellar hook-associated protein 2 [Bacillus sp. FJAT-45037]|uniref:flagellar hook-associated protein 2 n=1 Tax=Bacillus sp. FJAT-45037 TaxID=2011007 RepID=UPI000C24FD5B|nr:flagellar hook-associated protein 2 [Bacillus sp. FJAT-45037]